MTLLQIYLLWSVGYATYALGLQHGRGDRRWRSVGLALVTGLVWPAALAYGLYAAHHERKKPG